MRGEGISELGQPGRAILGHPGKSPGLPFRFLAFPPAGEAVLLHLPEPPFAPL